jgi:hypothetical protein
MNDEARGVDGEGDADRALSAVGDAFGDLVSGIPAPIRKNAFKAFTRLCTVAVEYPVTLLENAIAERRAESLARVKLIDTSANQLAEQMQTAPEYVRAAATKFAHKIVRERVNVDQVSAFAAADLNSVPLAIPDESVTEACSISEDWLNAFENEASQMSSEKMQRLFAKILAGEIRTPTSYSIKTVKLMGQLDNSAAAIFQLFCSLSVSIRDPKSNIVLDARVVSMGNAASNSLKAYGLGFGELNTLHEYGLIISDYNSYADYAFAVLDQGQIVAPMFYQRANWYLMPKVAPPIRQEFRLEGVALSRSGKELLFIVDTEPNERYTAALKDFFDMKGLVLSRFG